MWNHGAPGEQGPVLPFPFNDGTVLYLSLLVRVVLTQFKIGRLGLGSTDDSQVTCFVCISGQEQVSNYF
jgi:hypothetical protein